MQLKSVMQTISGTDIAKDISKKISVELEERKATGEMPSLHIILATEDAAARTYVKLKEKKAAELGIEAQIYEFPKDCEAADVIRTVKEVAAASSLNGVMVQLPLYPHLQESQTEILNAIPAKQDVDGLSATNLGLLTQSPDSAIWPATVAAICECVPLDTIYTEGVGGLHAVIINHSSLIGRPLADVLLHKGMTVTICHEHTKDLKAQTLQADLVISATGQVGLLDHTYFKQGAVVIDVTSISTPDGVKGDVLHSPELEEKLAAITPVPGGVGPLTVACLMRNVVG